MTSVFLELLERQFPIETTADPLQLRTAQHYAQHLNVHINYLNRAVKEVTGKSTTTNITERIITEAKALLQHTDWGISEIAYALGFDYPTYFNIISLYLRTSLSSSMKTIMERQKVKAFVNEIII